MNAYIETLAKQQIMQKRVKKASKTNIHGILPMYCQHSSLCLFRNTAKAKLNLHEYNVFQVGHWTSCKYVWPFLHSLLTHEVYHEVQSESRIALTELIPHSLEALIDLSEHVDIKAFQDIQTPGMKRDPPFVWQSFDAHKVKPTWKAPIEGSPTIILPINHFIRQKPVHDDKVYVVVFHILVPKRLSKFSMPLEHFVQHNYSFWSNSMTDIALPENSFEASLPSEKLCADCLRDIFGQSFDAAEHSGEVGPGNETHALASNEMAFHEIEDDDNKTVPIDSSTREVVASVLSIKRFLL
jgi:hypothetical protein